MTAVILLNVVLSVFVVIAILALLSWGIVSDRKLRIVTARRARAQRTRVARPARRPLGARMPYPTA